MGEQKLLIIEDDTNINNLLAEALTKAGYQCQQAFSGTEGRLLMKSEHYSLVLLDLMLPGLTGEELLAEIRRSGSMPVIVLSAKDDMDNKLDLLTNGADDYITKPFDIKEVIARIQIQLRHAMDTVQEENEELMSYRQMQLDRKSFTVCVEGEELPTLTRQEFAILELLLKHPKQVYSKEDIFEYAWNMEYMGETKTLDVHISNIRKKIKSVTPQEYIETVWGIGYRMKS